MALVVNLKVFFLLHLSSPRDSYSSMGINSTHTLLVWICACDQITQVLSDGSNSTGKRLVFTEEPLQESDRVTLRL